jgi:hypothetical protein
MKPFLKMVGLWLALITVLIMSSCESRSSREVRAAKFVVKHHTYVITMLVDYNTGERDTVQVHTHVQPSVSMESIVQTISYTKSRHNCVVLPGESNKVVCDVYLFKVLSIELLSTAKQ